MDLYLCNVCFCSDSVNFFSLDCNSVIHCYRKKNPYEKVTSVTVMLKCLSAKTRTICIANLLTSFFLIGALFTERYSRRDHNAYLEIPFNKNSNYVETSQLICIDQLTGFCKSQISI